MSKVIEFRVYIYGPNGGPIDNSFESAEQHLVEDLGAYFEPDGSFAWSGIRGTEQIFGNLYDANGRLQYAEVQGKASRTSIRQVLLSIVGSDCHSDLGALTKDDVPAELRGLTIKSLNESNLTTTGRNDFQSFEELAFSSPL